MTEIKTDTPIKGPDGLRPISADRYILAQGNTASLMTVHGDSASIQVLKDNIFSTGVSVSGSKGYVVEGNTSSNRTNPKYKNQDPGDFRVYILPLPKS